MPRRLPRRVLKVPYISWLSARAETLTASHPHFARGLAKLEELAREQPATQDLQDVFSVSYVEYCLLNAYRLGGDQVNAERTALRIASRMVIERALYGRE